MSRIGKEEIEIPQGVEVNIDDNLIRVRGQKGKLGKKINSAIAPISPILGADGEEKSYCGSSLRGLNQKLFVLNPGIQCIQLEIKKSGFRENENQAIKKAKLLSEAMKEILN